MRFHASHLGSGPVSGYRVTFLRRKDGLRDVTESGMTGVW